MSAREATRRSYGTGSLYIRVDRHGRETWYGKWRASGRQVKRRIGDKRATGSRDGLTRPQAEAELRRLTAEARPVAARVGVTLTIVELDRHYRDYLTKRGRNPATLRAVESGTRVWLAPFFGDRSLDSITREDVADLIATMEADGLGAKSIRNYIGTLSAMLAYAQRRRWAASNPARMVELPDVARSEEIRFLTRDEIEQVIAAAAPGPYQALDRTLFLTAAMTGLRAGELVALRWRDVDWIAARVRVRQNYVLGEFGTPKSRRSTRSVPLADAVGAALDHHFKASAWQADDDLVFAHPITGEPLSKHQNLRRFRAALRAAGLDDSHVFHDLRHTFGTQMAAVGTPIRTLQEWMGHRDLMTTQIYADYAPSGRDAELIGAAFGGDWNGHPPGQSQGQGTNGVPI